MSAAVDILLEEGMEHFTPTRIAERAGLHKPAFYTHFDDVEACLGAVAIQVIAADYMKSLTARVATLPSPTPEEVATGRTSPEVMEQMIDAIHQELLTVQAHERLYRMTWRYRYSDGPLGKAVRELDRHALEYWVDYFWRLAVQYQIDPMHFREIAELADHLIGFTYRAISRVLDGRVPDLRVEAERVYRYILGMLSLEFRRMLGVPLL